MRYLIIFLALSGCTTTQVMRSCEKAQEYIAAAEAAIQRFKAACGVVPE